LHLTHEDIKTLQIDVQNELDVVDTWIRSNRLTIKYCKTAYMQGYSANKKGVGTHPKISHFKTASNSF